MAGFADLLTGLMAGGMAMQTWAAYNGAKDTKKSYNYNAVVDENNAQLADQQAHDAITRGQINETNQELKTAQLAGKQRNLMASRGVDLSEGSPLTVLVSTQFMGDRDAAQIATNAGREAWGHEVEASNYRNNAKLLKTRADSISPFQNAAGTLLTTGGTVASKWYQMDKGIQPYGW